jgi:hypothetical protein
MIQSSVQTDDYLIAPQSEGANGPDTYEELLSRSLDWALTEGSLFFQNRGSVQTAMRRVCQRLDEMGTPYAVAGGMALYLHGYRRFTEDVDILITRDGLDRLHKLPDGRGFFLPFEGSKNLRDSETKVKIEFLIAGMFPGDGKPKPIAFPNPATVAERRSGVSVVNLKTLIELKLASGMNSRFRLRDLVDVGELIAAIELPRELGLQIDPSVRDRFYELWDLHGPIPRYVTVLRESPSDPQSSATLKEMLADGIQIETAPDRTLMNDYLLLYTGDETTAKKYGMKPEKEFFSPDK